jgi:pimeloyl-ACP methyl ester carboxylesterase
VIQGLDLGRCVVVGHSLGGAAAIAYAGAHPDSVTGLVLVGTPGRSSPAQTKQIMGAMEADYDSVSEQYWKKLLEGARPEVERQVRDERHHVRRDAALAIMKAVFAYDPLPDLRKYPGPKHLIDTAVADSPGSLHALAPDIPRDTIAGTSHWTYMDAPRHFNELLDRCLHVMK